MQSYRLATLCTLFLMSCSKDEDAGALQGSWKLDAQYIDPGDGSGTYLPVSSERMLTISSKGKVESNGDLCSMSLDTSEPSSGEISFADSSLLITSCQQDLVLGYTLIADTLYVYYPCFEGCGQKYIRQ